MKDNPSQNKGLMLSQPFFGRLQNSSQEYQTKLGNAILGSFLTLDARPFKISNGTKMCISIRFI